MAEHLGPEGDRGRRGSTRVDPYGSGARRGTVGATSVGAHASAPFAQTADSTREAALAQLHDIVLPEPVSMVPATWGWAALVGGVLLGIAVAVALARRRRRANRYRVEALAELEAIRRRSAEGGARAGALGAIPALLKRTALAGAPRAEVASLAGESWLAFLDARIGGSEFREGVGRRILDIGYLPPRRIEEIPDDQVEALLALTDRWIREHRHHDAADTADTERGNDARV